MKQKWAKKGFEHTSWRSRCPRMVAVVGLQVRRTLGPLAEVQQVAVAQQLLPEALQHVRG